MARALPVVVVALSVALASCGGGGRAREGARSSATRTRSLGEILGPLGVHQTPAQLAEIAAFIHRWERDPMAPVPENTSERSTAFLMLAWLTESPDVTVITSALPMLCEGHGADVGPITTMGSIFGMAAYLIEHPGVDGHDAEVQAAGIRGALLWYEASLRDGGGHNDVLDELLEVRASGDLAAWWSARVTFTGD